MKTAIRMYSGEVYHVEEDLTYIDDVLERPEACLFGKRFIELKGYRAPSGHTARRPKAVLLDVARIESMEER